MVQVKEFEKRLVTIAQQAYSTVVALVDRLKLTQMLAELLSRPVLSVRNCPCRPSHGQYNADPTSLSKH